MGITGLDKQHAMFMLTLDRSLSGAAKAVGCVLIDRRNLETGLCYPSIELIAAETQFDVRTVKRALTELKRVDWISWRRQGRSNHYDINWGRSRALQNARDSRIAQFKDQREQGAKGDKTVTYQPPQTGDNSVTHSESKCDISGAKGDSGVTYKGGSPVTLNLEDKPRNKTRESDEFENNNFENGNGAHTEHVGEKQTARHEEERDTSTQRTPIKLTPDELATRRWRCDTMMHFIKTADSEFAVDDLPGGVAEAATAAELKRPGAGAAFILKHLKRDRAAAAASTDAKAVDFDDSGEQAAAE